MEVIDDVTGHVKVEMFDFSGLMSFASKISTLVQIKPMNRHGW